MLHYAALQSFIPLIQLACCTMISSKSSAAGALADDAVVHSPSVHSARFVPAVTSQSHHCSISRFQNT